MQTFAHNKSSPGHIAGGSFLHITPHLQEGEDIYFLKNFTFILFFISTSFSEIFSRTDRFI